MAGSVRDKDNGYRALLKRMQEAAKPNELTVGIHEAEGSEAKEGNDGEAGDMTLAEIAALHEFGIGVPRRSFIADWVDEGEPRHNAQIKAMTKAVVEGKVESVEQGLARLGSLFAAEVQKRISEGIDPPNAEATIKRKGSSKPLIDTGQLRTSIQPNVNGKKV